jgi:hypothetical protein
MNNNEQNNTNQTPSSSIITTPTNSRPSTPDNLHPLNPLYNRQAPNAPVIDRQVAKPVGDNSNVVSR